MSDETRYPQVMRLCAESPWAIRTEKLSEIRELLALRASGGRFTAEEIEARIGSGPAHKQGATTGSVAIIPIYGVIMPKADLMNEMSGGTNAEALMDSVRAAAANPQIDSILLDIDSPGGVVGLVPELAAEIRAARDQKPVVAIANTQAASAGYWLAAQATELVVTPSGEVGSIGVYGVHEDISAKLEKEGVSAEIIQAGKYKVEGNPLGPLSDEARGAIQAKVDAYYDMFIADVALGRGADEASVRGGFGEGRMVRAKDAVAAGMADRVDTFEATVQRMIGDAMNSKASRAVSALKAQSHALANTTTSLQSLGINDFQTGYAATSGSPPLAQITIHPQAADSGLFIARRVSAVRDDFRALVADMQSLDAVHPERRLTAAKRAALTEANEDSKRLAAEVDEWLAQSAAEPGSDVLARGVLSEGLRRHANLIGAPE